MDLCFGRLPLGSAQTPLAGRYKLEDWKHTEGAEEDDDSRYHVEVFFAKKHWAQVIFHREK